MPYKDPQKQKEAIKKAVQKYRKGITEAGITEAGITDKYQNVRPIIKALADPVKRKKIEAIYQSLKAHNVLSNTYYGCGTDSTPFEEVGKLLDCLT